MGYSLVCTVHILVDETYSLVWGRAWGVGALTVNANSVNNTGLNPTSPQYSSM
jgi:hypothetical protein